MRKSNHEAIRALLRASDGMTARQIADAIGMGSSSAVYRAIKGMPDTYVDRWEKKPGLQLTQVWCVVVPPPDCPKPNLRDEL